MIRHQSDRGQSLPSICPRCKKSDRLERRPVENVHHAELRCGRCGLHIRWIGRDVSFDEAMAFKMPFGQYIGQEMQKIPLAYLDWLVRASTNVPQKVLQRARLILEMSTIAGDHDAHVRDVGKAPGIDCKPLVHTLPDPRSTHATSVAGRGNDSEGMPGMERAPWKA